MAISVARAAPRASSMLARLRHAINSTIAAIPISSAEAPTKIVSFVGRVDIDSRDRGASTTVWSRLTSGKSAAS